MDERAPSSPPPANAAHTETLSIISHDIRAPLGVILGAVAELGSPAVGALSDDQRALLQLVRRSCEKLSRLANNVSFLHRVESGRVDVARQPTDLRMLVRQALESFQRAGELGKIAVVSEMPEGAVTASVDPERATHAIVNVLTNALRFARKEVRVSVSSDAMRAHVTVEDDGPGISASAFPGLFDRAVRLRADQGGKAVSGLGLLVVKGIVDAHGGDAHAENRAPQAQGARVRLSFPLR